MGDKWNVLQARYGRHDISCQKQIELHQIIIRNVFFTFCQRGQSGEGKELQITKEESGVGWVTNLENNMHLLNLKGRGGGGVPEYLLFLLIWHGNGPIHIYTACLYLSTMDIYFRNVRGLHLNYKWEEKGKLKAPPFLVKSFFKWICPSSSPHAEFLE